MIFKKPGPPCPPDILLRGVQGGTRPPGQHFFSNTCRGPENADNSKTWSTLPNRHLLQGVQGGLRPPCHHYIFSSIPQYHNLFWTLAVNIQRSTLPT